MDILFSFQKLDISVICMQIGRWSERSLWFHAHSAFLLSSFFLPFGRFLKTPDEIIQSRSDRSDPPESPDSPASPAYKEGTLEVSPSSTPDPSSPESLHILSVSPLPWSLKYPSLYHKISPSPTKYLQRFNSQTTPEVWRVKWNELWNYTLCSLGSIQFIHYDLLVQVTF